MKIRITKPSNTEELNKVMPVGSVVDVITVEKSNNTTWYDIDNPLNAGEVIGVPDTHCEVVEGDERPEVAYNDPVHHPSHYTDGKIEVIDFIEDKNLGFHLGNAVKYISRAGKKDKSKTAEDIKKAIWYLNRYLEVNHDSVS